MPPVFADGSRPADRGLPRSRWRAAATRCSARAPPRWPAWRSATPAVCSAVVCDSGALSRRTPS